ncbi:uncharacterized protein CTRU02_204260 [Colletotrichum truncatum]|uniref:Uncharacterized protein n=1 Tax=Colletotrichum truncatum TaxID=5467 RepID=A0ACC3ZC41_COLTU
MLSRREINTATDHSPELNYQQGNLLNNDEFYSSDAMDMIFPEHMFRNNNVAVIMETEPAKVANLVPIMLHFASMLGPEWPVVLLTLQEQWEVPPSLQFQQLMEAKRIIVLYLPPGTSFPDHKSVSFFMIGRWLWELFAPANRILMFQADSILCSQSSKRIEDFLEWDFIGAPIAKKFGQGYNGGLSIRNPKLFLEIAKQQERQPVRLKVEDQWFYTRLRERDAHLPSAEVAKTFVVETIYYDEPLGYHQPARWQKGRMEEIKKWCPEVNMLTGGQHFYR